jgi:4'-phosphopantetheinyl transferase
VLPERRLACKAAGVAEVEVFRTAVLDPVAVEGMLTGSERTRQSELTDSASRARAATARALLRAATAHRLGVTPTEVRLDYRCAVCGGRHGKPVVRSARGSMHASVSYSGTVVLVAVSDVPVGVDVEQCAATAFPGFESIALSALERAEFAAMTPQLRAELWVRKEAVLKVSGVGLSVSPESLHIGHPSNGQVPVPGSILAAGCASVLALPVPAGYRAAVAVAGRESPRLIVRDGRPLLAAAEADVRTATA